MIKKILFLMVLIVFVIGSDSARASNDWDGKDRQLENIRQYGNSVGIGRFETSTLDFSNEVFKDVVTVLPSRQHKKLLKRKMVFDAKAEKACYAADEDDDKCRETLINYQLMLHTASREANYVVQTQSLVKQSRADLAKVEQAYLEKITQPERERFKLGVRAWRAVTFARCHDRSDSNSGIDPWSGLERNGWQKLFCEFQNVREKALEIDLLLSDLVESTNKPSQGCFYWSDGVGVMSELPSEPNLQSGSIDLRLKEKDLTVRFQYTGINGHTCTFDRVAKKIDSYFIYSYESEYSKEKCELKMSFTPNFLLLSGVEPQSSCSAELGCGFRAYLPDVIPLTVRSDRAEKPSDCD